MEIFYNNEKKTNLSLALGFFDGIHLGHQKVIENAVEIAKKNNLKSAVVSFCDHPSCLILKRSPQYIIPLNDKIEKIKNLGVDYLYLIDFNQNLAQKTKEEYFNMLLEMTSPKAITTGFNHFFGKDKQGDTQFLSDMCKKNNITYTKIEPVKIQNTIISSSQIRKALLKADFATTEQMLNSKFYIKGIVQKGQQLGRKIGFETINIKYPENIIKIPFGVYCTQCHIENKNYNSITNWGIKPTVNNTLEPITETHILDFDGNLYDKPAQIFFLKQIRTEKKFDNLENLKTQIKKDVEFCKNYFEN